MAIKKKLIKVKQGSNINKWVSVRETYIYNKYIFIENYLFGERVKTKIFALKWFAFFLRLAKVRDPLGLLKIIF